MHPEVAGRGYATELVRAAVNTGFDVHRFERIAAFARAENGASIRVLTKCGFTFVRFESELDRNHYELARTHRPEVPK
jgi:RimJ/RimL family protein N-acetyltransferase